MKKLQVLKYLLLPIIITVIIGLYIYQTIGIANITVLSCSTRPQSIPNLKLYLKISLGENLTGKQAYVKITNLGYNLEGKIIMDNNTHITLQVPTNHPETHAMGKYINFTMLKTDVIGKPI